MQKTRTTTKKQFHVTLGIVFPSVFETVLQMNAFTGKREKVNGQAAFDYNMGEEHRW